MRSRRRVLEYLAASTATGMEAFRISQMNGAANLGKKMSAAVEHWMDAEVGVGFSVLIEVGQERPAFRVRLFRQYSFEEGFAGMALFLWPEGSGSILAIRSTRLRIAFADLGTPAAFGAHDENSFSMDGLDRPTWKSAARLLTYQELASEICELVVAS